MSLSLTEPSAESLPFGLVLQRIAVPFFLFAAVLTGLLLLSWFLVLPIFTSVEVAGKTHTVESLRSYRADLLSEISVAETDRSKYILPVHDEAYLALRLRREKHPSFFSLFQVVKNVAASVTAQQDAVHASSIEYSSKEQTLDVSGDVRFVGPRSMTVLAEFVEAMKKHLNAADVTLPRFVREEHKDIGPHSPFSFSLQL